MEPTPAWILLLQPLRLGSQVWATVPCLPPGSSAQHKNPLQVGGKVFTVPLEGAVPGLWLPLSQSRSILSCAQRGVWLRPWVELPCGQEMESLAEV